MKYLSPLIFFLFVMSFSAFTQNHLNYHAQFINYSEFSFHGLRQNIEISHYLNSRLKVFGGVHLTSGRGKDISSDFKKDYILFSKNNWQNVPAGFGSGFNNFQQGVYNYKRISNGVIQMSGYSFSLGYDLIKSGNINLEIKAGYARNKIDLTVREIDIETDVVPFASFPISNPQKIIYPASIFYSTSEDYINFNPNIGYKINPKINIGVSMYIQYGTYRNTYDLGGGIYTSLKI